MVARAKDLIFQTVIRLSWVGQRRGWEWLTYHPGVFAFYHWSAAQQCQGVVGSLLQEFPGASFADVGSGTGVYAAALQKAGRDVTACERSRLARLFARLQGARPVRFDLNHTEPAAIRSVDVAYSFEVAEHLPEHLGRRLVAFMLDIAPTVVFSAARPGQGGQGHINEQPASYWETIFDEAGADIDPGTTISLSTRFADSGTVLWIKDNVQVFRRREKS